MCGRFSNDAKPEQIEDEFKIGKLNPKLFAPRYNIAPTQMIPVVLEQSGDRIIESLRWGLIPSWAKDKSIGSKMINARAETLAEKPSFRDAFKNNAVLFRLPAFTNGRNKPQARNNRFIFG